jgi:hypothetical protein
MLPCIQVARESLYNNQNSPSVAALGAAHHPLSSGVAYSHEDGLIEL